jgi:predicted nucleic acid-binding protein
VGLITEVGTGPIALDTAIFIYMIEENPQYLPEIVPLFREADEGRRELVTSALTLLEVLVVPYRAGNRALAEQYEAVLTRSRGVRIVDISRDQLRAAAQLQAATGVKTPDALQLVAAISRGCTSFVTNDRRLPAIPGLNVLRPKARKTRS